ncbi:MAG TPA: hypothetical protein VFM18_17030 [Methanosarcina sp.]|nr:hypothetical protein [Methanosarcina sp.]
MADYFVIRNSDGDTYVEQMSQTELEEKLSENYWGDVKFLDAVPDSDTNYWGEVILIIRGSIAVPRAEEVVVRYKL